MTLKHEWQEVTKYTYRLVVPGGWLYERKHDDGSFSMTFVKFKGEVFTKEDIEVIVNASLIIEREQATQIACKVVEDCFVEAQRQDIAGRPMNLSLRNVTDSIKLAMVKT
jgi:hypothetical protein